MNHGMLAGWMRRVGTAIRHAPGLRSLSPVWGAVRPLYQAALRGAAGGHGVVVHVGGEPIRLDAAFTTVSWERVEREGYDAYRAALHAGDLVFDVGAHLGTYAVLGARAVGPTGRVIAFEPVPGTRAALERHLRYNDVADRVTVRDAACSDTPGMLTLHIVDEVADAEASPVARAGARAIEVPRTTLDLERGRLARRVALVKIDVEGQELAVLEGARALLVQDRPLLLVSLHPPMLAAQGIATADALAWLHAAGYGTRVLSEGHEVQVLATPQGG